MLYSTLCQHSLVKCLQNWLHGTVATSKWLKMCGISHELMSRYQKSNWVKSIGYGAFIRLEEEVEWFGGLHALQFQLGLDVHIGGKSALEMHGLSHYLPLGQPTLDILKRPKTIIPKWFIKHPWPENIRVVEYNFLSSGLGIIDKTIGNIPIKVSSRERSCH
jgi:hypothetical protein